MLTSGCRKSAACFPRCVRVFGPTWSVKIWNLWKYLRDNILKTFQLIQRVFYYRNRRHLLSKFPMKPEQCFSLLIHRHFRFDTPSRLNTNVKRFGPHGNRRRVLFCFFPTHMNSSSFLLANSLPYNCSVFFTTHQQNYCYVNEQFTISSGHFYLSLRGL